jgi:hypothetical protein
VNAIWFAVVIVAAAVAASAAVDIILIFKGLK